MVYLQGFSADWWKGKHNTHHAAPNELEHDSKSPVDPDIDTLPLVAWSVEMLESLPNASHRALVRAQHYFFFPILLFARLSWCQQSVAHAYTMFQVGQMHVPADQLHPGCQQCSAMLNRTSCTYDASCKSQHAHLSMKAVKV